MIIESKLAQIIEQVYQAPTAGIAKSILIPFLRDSKIKESDKKKMIQQAEKLNQLAMIQYYATNAFLKYEGLGL
jgi:hypothetical protein